MTLQPACSTRNINWLTIPGDYRIFGNCIFWCVIRYVRLQHISHRQGFAGNKNLIWSKQIPRADVQLIFINYPLVKDIKTVVHDIRSCWHRQNALQQTRVLPGMRSQLDFTQFGIGVPSRFWPDCHYWDKRVWGVMICRDAKDVIWTKSKCRNQV